MIRLFSISIILALVSFYCSADNSKIYLEGKVVIAQDANPVPIARVELHKMTGESLGFFEYNTELVTSIKTDSLGNYKIQADIEDCRGLRIRALKEGFHQVGLYDPKCTLARWQRFDITLTKDE